MRMLLFPSAVILSVARCTFSSPARGSDSSSLLQSSEPILSTPYQKGQATSGSFYDGPEKQSSSASLNCSFANSVESANCPETAIIDVQNLQKRTSHATPGAAARYIIYFHEVVPDTQRTEYAAKLAKKIPQENIGSLALGNKIYAVVASLTPAQVKEFKTDIISTIDVDEEVDFDNMEFESHTSESNSKDDGFGGSLAKRAEGKMITRYNTGYEMSFLSQEPGTEIDDSTPFTFMDYAGAGATVYTMDSGFNLAHDEFRKEINEVKRGEYSTLPLQVDLPEGLAAEKKSIWKNFWGKIFEEYVPPVGDLDTRDPDGHGTCVASRIVGAKYGSAKGANLKILRSNRLSETLKAYEAIYNDIRADKMKGNKDFLPVLALTFSRDKRNEHELQWLSRIHDEGSVIISAIGNKQRKPPTRHFRYPALFAQLLPNMVAVGSVTVPRGNRPWFAPFESFVKIHAPGDEDGHNGISCASHLSNTEYVRKAGSSLASPTVAGIAAYIYSVEARGQNLDDPASYVVSKIHEYAYPRLHDDDALAVVWNGARLSECSPNSFRARQLSGSACQPTGNKFNIVHTIYVPGDLDAVSVISGNSESKCEDAVQLYKSSDSEGSMLSEFSVDGALIADMLSAEKFTLTQESPGSCGCVPSITFTKKADGSYVYKDGNNNEGFCYSSHKSSETCEYGDNETFELHQLLACQSLSDKSYLKDC